MIDLERAEKLNRRLAPADASNIMVVGERANGDPETGERYCFEPRLARGAFYFGSSRAKLLSIGLRWDYSINLRPALPTKVAGWDAVDKSGAEGLAIQIESFALHRGLTLVLLGNRVAQAFKLSFVPMTEHLTWNFKVPAVILPHPSGRNQFWNKGTEKTKAWIALRFPSNIDTLPV